MIRLLVLTLTVGLVAGCSNQVDYAQVADDYLEQRLGREQMPALEFFAQGGHYYDEPGWTSLDQEYIVPIVRGLKELGGDPFVVLNEKDPKRATDLVVELPSDSAQLKKYEEFINAKKEGFPGLILDQWGHRYLALDFADEEEAEVIGEW